MSKIKLLLNVVGDLRSLADSVQAMADAMENSEPVATAPSKDPVSDKETRQVTKAVTLEQVRAVLAEKSQDGLTAEVRGLLEKFGAAKLSQIDSANYAALLTEAEGLGNG